METDIIKFVFCFPRQGRNNAVEIKHWLRVELMSWVSHSLLNCSPVLLHVSWSQEFQCIPWVVLGSIL